MPEFLKNQDGRYITDGLSSKDFTRIFDLIRKEQTRKRREPRQPGGCKLKTAPVRPVVAARPAEYVCSEDLFY